MDSLDIFKDDFKSQLSEFNVPKTNEQPFKISNTFIID